MRNRIKLAFIGLLLAGLSLSVAAVDAADMFAAETLVTDEGSATRNAALSELLAEVLVRVSGNSAIKGQPAARELLDAAPSLVQQYRYRTADRDGEVARYLWARFDQPVVERMMRERNLPVWAQRPRVLLWLASERRGQRALLNLDGYTQARATAIAHAQQRGMPLQLPLMDLEDQTQLTPADMWADYQAGIRQASARYPHELILVGRLSAQGKDQWRGAWSLIDSNDSQTFQTSPQGLGETLVFALDQAQNLLAARYAPLPGTGVASGTLVRFSDVYDLAAYGRLLTFLDGLEPVTLLMLRQVEGDSLVFEFQLRGDEHELVRALESGGLLVAEPGPIGHAGFAAAPDTATAVNETEADLYYRLLN